MFFPNSYFGGRDTWAAGCGEGDEAHAWVVGLERSSDGLQVMDGEMQVCARGLQQRRWRRVLVEAMERRTRGEWRWLGDREVVTQGSMEGGDDGVCGWWAAVGKLGCSCA